MLLFDFYNLIAFVLKLAFFDNRKFSKAIQALGKQNFIYQQKPENYENAFLSF
jgi:hypothetical protein